MTAYITAAMRSAGYTTFGKVTGTVPTIFFPEGSSGELKRRGPARVQEQFGVIKRVARGGAECLVLECMSISPELQSVETRFFRPGIYVITNIRDDHRESMGMTVDQQAEAMISAIPRSATVITGAERYSDRIRTEAKGKESRVVSIENAIGRIKRSLPENVIKENVALACSVAEEAGLDFDRALDSVLESVREEDGKLIEIDSREGTIRFVDGFSVNDVESAERYVNYWTGMLSQRDPIGVILNTRSDRPFRSVSFAGWIAASGRVSRVVITGSHAPAARRALLKAGFQAENITLWRKRQILRAAALLPETFETESVVFGLGNIHGAGFDIPEILRDEFC